MLTFCFLYLSYYILLVFFFFFFIFIFFKRTLNTHISLVFFIRLSRRYSPLFYFLYFKSYGKLLQHQELLKQIEMADVEILEMLEALLAPFKAVTLTMSTESSSSISLMRPLLHKLMTSCKPDVSLGDLNVIHEAKAAMYHDLKTR